MFYPTKDVLVARTVGESINPSPLLLDPTPSVAFWRMTYPGFPEGAQKRGVDEQNLLSGRRHGWSTSFDGYTIGTACLD
jgi:hypothetical protein